jgi:hypothetical protein
MATTRATKETLFLRREFTVDEQLMMSRDLAQAYNRNAAIDDEEKSMKATIKERKTGVELTIGSLSRKLNDGYEMDNVPCTLHWDSPNVGEVTYRDPLGNVVKTRAMNIEERQEELPFEESAANINAFFGGLDVTPEPEPPTADSAAPIVDEQAPAEFKATDDDLPANFESGVRESLGVPEPFPATLKDQLAQAETMDATQSTDKLYALAKDSVSKRKKTGAVILQRELHISYAQAVHLLDRLRADGLIDQDGNRMDAPKKSGPKELKAFHEQQIERESGSAPTEEAW